MLEEDVLRMLVRGTRGGKSIKGKVMSKRKPKAKSMKKGGAKSGYMAHVKKYHKLHPNLTWKEAMVKAKTSYNQRKRQELWQVLWLEGERKQVQ